MPSILANDDNFTTQRNNENFSKRDRRSNSLPRHFGTAYNANTTTSNDHKRVQHFKKQYYDGHNNATAVQNKNVNDTFSRNSVDRASTIPSTYKSSMVENNKKSNLKRAPSLRSLRKLWRRLRKAATGGSNRNERNSSFNSSANSNRFVESQSGDSGYSFVSNHSHQRNELHQRSSAASSGVNCDSLHIKPQESMSSLSNYDSGTPSIDYNSVETAAATNGCLSGGSAVITNTNPALCGLQNHGNTCYMNAVVQCLSNTDLLAEYFVSDRYVSDLNPLSDKSRKLGTHGELAIEFAFLLKSLWFCICDKDQSRHFVEIVESWSKRTAGSCGFKLGQQHDAQEFLAWLLDKVHEDLNSGTKKKIKNSKSSRYEPEDISAWRQYNKHLQCNHSFVYNLFQAQFRSSVICPLCNSPSVTFDPYTCLSLSVPQSTSKPLFVVMVYYNRHPRLLCLGLNAEITATFGEVKQCLAVEGKIDIEQLLLCELSCSGFLRTFRDSQTISSSFGPSTSNDQSYTLYAIETPPSDFDSNERNGLSLQVNSANSSPTGQYMTLVAVNTYLNTSIDKWERFGSPICVQVNRESSYAELHAAVVGALRSQLIHGYNAQNVLQNSFKVKLCEIYPVQQYVLPDVPMPLYTESVDQALIVYNNEFGPTHAKVVLEWDSKAKAKYFHHADEIIFDHISASDLRQEVQSPKVLNLTDCIRSYGQTEWISLEGWRCENCHMSPSNAEKSIGLYNLPAILVIHLKRFKQLSTGQTLKLEPLLEFPLHGLDLSEFVSQSAYHSQLILPTVTLTTDKKNIPSLSKRSPKLTKKQLLNINTNANDCVYDLYAVCNHHGESINSGHYTAYCRHLLSNSWYCYDDERISRIDKSKVVTKDAYLLFYERRGLLRDSSEHGLRESGFADHWFYRLKNNNDNVPNRRSQKYISSTASEGIGGTLPKSFETSTMNAQLNSRAIAGTLTSGSTDQVEQSLRNQSMPTDLQQSRLSSNCPPLPPPRPVNNKEIKDSPQSPQRITAGKGQRVRLHDDINNMATEAIKVEPPDLITFTPTTPNNRALKECYLDLSNASERVSNGIGKFDSSKLPTLNEYPTAHELENGNIWLTPKQLENMITYAGSTQHRTGLPTASPRRHHSSATSEMKIPRTSSLEDTASTVAIPNFSHAIGTGGNTFSKRAPIMRNNFLYYSQRIGTRSSKETDL